MARPLSETLRITVATGATDGPADGPRVGVEIRDPALAEAVANALRAVFDRALADRVDTAPDRVEGEAAGPVAGRWVAVPVDGRTSPTALVATCERLEALGAAAIQLVWPGRPARAEAAAFAALEAWRGAKRRCPLALAPDDAPSPRLRFLTAS